jgi:2OG-Fe(II) oxygenase superfamily
MNKSGCNYGKSHHSVYHNRNKPKMHPNSDKDDLNKESQKVLVKVSKNLVLADLMSLIQGKFLALRIPNYYPEKGAKEISQKLIEEETLEHYLRAPEIGVRRTGMTFFENNGNTEILEFYYEQAKTYVRKIRQVCFPYLSPIDMLRLNLSDIWLADVNIENIHGRRILAGIGRIVEDASKFHPHQNIFVQDIRDSGLVPNPDYEELTIQLSSNIYLQMPKVGGELQIWDLKPSIVEQKAIWDAEYKYEEIITRTSLPPATVIIKHKVGDLILFDSGRIHAVRSSKKELRVSMSMFIGYREEDKLLIFWS